MTRRAYRTLHTRTTYTCSEVVRFDSARLGSVRFVGRLPCLRPCRSAAAERPCPTRGGGGYNGVFPKALGAPLLRKGQRGRRFFRLSAPNTADNSRLSRRWKAKGRRPGAVSLTDGVGPSLSAEQDRCRVFTELAAAAVCRGRSPRGGARRNMDSTGPAIVPRAGFLP